MELTDDELRVVKEAVAAIGYSATGRHLGIAKTQVQHIVKGGEVKPETLARIQPRLEVPLPDLEQLARESTERRREAARRRWEREGERQRFSDMAKAQWSDPEARQIMSQIKLATYAERPEIALRIKVRQTGRSLSTKHKEAIALSLRRRSARRQTRLLLLKQRAMLVLRNESSPKP